jgi:hypothetical protein
MFTSNYIFTDHRFRKSFRKKFAWFQRGRATCETDHWYLAFLWDIKVGFTFINRTLFFHPYESCRGDQYESSDRKLSTIPRNCSCDIATQKTRVSHSVCCIAGVGDLNYEAHLVVVLWVAVSYECFIGMIPILWSLNSYWSALQVSCEWKQNQVLFKTWSWSWHLIQTQDTNNLFHALCIPLETT